jgi:hypothetical protein
VHGRRKGGFNQSFAQVELHGHDRWGVSLPGTTTARGGTVLDLLFVGLTIVAFGVLWLLVKGVERFER